MTTQRFLLSAWNWNPGVIGVCLLALLGYAKVARFRSAARTGSFIGALLLFLLTLTSPVNALADGYLFSAHMLQHLLLLLVIPPLLLLGLPAWEATKESRTTDRTRPAWRRLRIHPFAAWLAGLSAMWIWHEPTLCNAATTIPSVRTIQIVSLITLGLVFWWPIVGPQLSRRLAPLLGVLYLFSACVGCTILGILITFAPVGVVCPVYLHPVDRLGILPLIRQGWGITAGIDQQTGGLMMWVPACGIYICGVIALLARWYRADETGAARAEAAAADRARALPAAGATKENA
jgi:putative membrane protein